VPIHPQHLSNVVDQIRLIASQVSNISEKFERNRLIFITDDGLAFSLNDEVKELYEKLTSEFLNKLKWSDKYTEKKTSEVIKDLVLKAMQGVSVDEIKNLVEERVRTYDAFDRISHVYIPISGVRVQKQVDLFGVKFKQNSQRLKERVLKNIKDVVRQTLNDDEGKNESYKIANEHLEGIFKFPTIAECIIIADPDRAEQIALNRVRGILDVIRVSIPLTYPSTHKVKVGVGDEITFSSLKTISVSSEAARINESRIGPLALFDLNTTSIKKLRQQGLLKALTLQNKTDLTEVEELYLRAIHWLGDSQNQTETANKVLSLTTCLEIFFTPEKDSGLSISNTISESIALLMVKGLDNRKTVKKRIKDLYNLRSRITHGLTISIADEDLNQLMNFCYSVVRFIFKKLGIYKQRKDIQIEVEAKKLS
jgi:Apea-like HEPN